MPDPIDPKRRYDYLTRFLKEPSGKPVGHATGWPGGGGVIWSFCPAHPDGTKHKNRSLILWPDSRGMKCFAGCELEEILSGLGVTMSGFLDAAHDPEQRQDVTVPPARTERHDKVRPIRALPPQPPQSPQRDAPRGKDGKRLDDPGVLAKTYRYVCKKRGPLYGKVFLKERWEQANPQPGEKPAKRFLWKREGAEKYGLDGTDLTDMAWFNQDLVDQADYSTNIIITEGENAAEACTARQLVATCGPWGSSQTEFGSSLEFLRGRVVWLWPDNDSAGRDYMRFLYRELRGIAKKIMYIRKAVPEKGDAVEYFEGDESKHRPPGRPEEVFDLTSTEPVCEYMSEDTIRVLIPQNDNPSAVSFLFSDIGQSRRSLHAEVSVLLTSYGGSELPYRMHLDLMSVNSVSTFRLSLEKAFEGKFNWTVILAQAFALVKEAIRNRDQAIDTADIPDSGPVRWVVEDLLVENEINIIFGTGSSTKSYQAFAMALSIGLGVDWCGRRVRQKNVLIIDYETNAVNYKRRMRRLAQGYGMQGVPPFSIYYWPARGKPLRDHKEALRSKIIRDGIGFVLIDSVVPACGGEAEKSVVAGDFFNDLHSLGVGITFLLIAHTTKLSDVDTQMPFGSVFFHNECRASYWVRKTPGTRGSGDVFAALVNRKLNDGELAKDFGVRLHFVGSDGPVELTNVDASRYVPEASDERSWHVRIYDALLHGALTLRGIVEALGFDSDDIKTREKVRSALSRGTEAGSFTTRRREESDVVSANDPGILMYYVPYS